MYVDRFEKKWPSTDPLKKTANEMTRPVSADSFFLGRPKAGQRAARRDFIH